jgi:hypothetical protein
MIECGAATSSRASRASMGAIAARRILCGAVAQGVETNRAEAKRIGDRFARARGSIERARV